jgi:hypothetical protein
MDTLVANDLKVEIVRMGEQKTPPQCDLCIVTKGKSDLECGPAMIHQRHGPPRRVDIISRNWLGTAETEYLANWQ